MTRKSLEVTAKVVTGLIVVAILYLGITRGYSFGYQVFHSEPLDQESGISLELTVLENQNPIEVGKQLEQHEIIGSANVFWLQSKLFETRIQPGTYMVSSNMSSREILVMLGKGKKE